MVARYDQIQIRQAPFGTVAVEYYWCGNLVYSMRVDQVDFSAGQSLMLSGIEGHIPITLSEA
jgi:hypothetical protein